MTSNASKDAMYSEIVYRGFVEPSIAPEEYTFGGRQVLGVPINPSKNWEEYLPEPEIQRNAQFDTNSCFIYGSLNQIETVIRFFQIQKGDYKDVNFSERFTAYFADWSPVGGNPHNVYQSVRHEGLLPEKVLPFSSDISHANYILDEMSEAYCKLALEWGWTIKHDWLFTKDDTNKHELLDTALAYCPVAVSVRAWEQDKNGIYIKDKGASDTHWCLVYRHNSDGTWAVYDTYEGVKKTLSADYDFGFAKRIVVRKAIEEKGLFTRLIEWIHEIFKTA